MENIELQNPLIEFDELQDKLETLKSLAYVLFLAGSNDAAVANDFDGALYLMNNISYEACQELERVKNIFA